MRRTALESRMFERHGLKVTLSENPGNSDTIQSLMHDQVDIVYTGIALALTSADKIKVRTRRRSTGAAAADRDGAIQTRFRGTGIATTDLS